MAVIIQRNRPPIVDRILSVLPKAYTDAYLGLAERDKALLSEIRLRAELPSSFTVSGTNIPVRANGRTVRSSASEIADILSNICDGSLYAYSDQIGKGYINALGTRIGVGGIACRANDSAADITTITSVCIRIPRSIPSAADKVTEHIATRGIGNTLGVLAISPPNCGKTTFLRALARNLSLCDGLFGMKVCIADERGEIYDDMSFDNCFCDRLVGIPKGLCAEIASRTLSAEVLVLDEIGNQSEARMLASACGNGVYVAASIHGNSLRDVMRHGYMSELILTGVFKTAYVLERRDDTISGSILDIQREMEYA